MKDSQKKSKEKPKSKVVSSVRLKWDSVADETAYGGLTALAMAVMWKAFQRAAPEAAERIFENLEKTHLSFVNAPFHWIVITIAVFCVAALAIPILFGRGTHKVTYAIRRSDGNVRIVERWYLLSRRIKQRRGQFVDRIAVGFAGETHVIQLVGDKGYVFDVLLTKDETRFREKLLELEKATALTVDRIN